jgi:hypothetical protein
VASISSVAQALQTQQGTHLVLEERIAKMADQQLATQDQLRRLTQQLQTRPALQDDSAGGELADARRQLAGLQRQVEAMQQQLSDCGRVLQQAGLSGDRAGVELREALERSSEGYMQVAALQEEVTALKGGKLQELADAVRQLQQQQQQATAQRREPRGEVMAWAPADMPPDTLQQHIARASGLSSGCILAVERRFVPPSRAEADRGSSGGNSSGGNSSGGNSSGGGSPGGSSGAGGAGGNGGRARQPNALYSILLLHPRFEATVLGGRTRKALAVGRVPIWLEQRLSEEERQARNALKPHCAQLRRDGARTRWRGAVLERLVQQGNGRRRWEQVLPGPPADPPPAGDGRARESAAAGAVGGQGAV